MAIDCGHASNANFLENGIGTAKYEKVGTIF